MGKEVVCFWNYNSCNQKTTMETGRLSKFLKGITADENITAYHRARYILTLRGRISTKLPGEEKVYLPLNNDLKNQVKIVLACVASGSAGSICDNT